MVTLSRGFLIYFIHLNLRMTLSYLAVYVDIFKLEVR